MHLISPLAAGILSAANGVARLYRRGTSTRATWYASFEADVASSSGADLPLDSTGSVIAYVNELVQVQVYDSQGQLLRDFVAGEGAYAVEVISPAFTGTDYTTGQQAVSKPTTAGALFDLWLLSAGAIDWKALYSGAATPLEDAFGAIYGMFFNVKSPAYGAVGDGTTNDAAAIQATYTAAAAAGGGIVVWPPGVYNIGSGISFSTGVSTFAVPGTVTLRQTTAATFCLRLNAALASGPDTPTIIHGIRFDSTVTNSATQVLLDPASDDEIHIVHCRFGGSAFATGAGITFTGTLTWKTVIRDCYFQAQAAVSCVVDTALAGAGEIVMDGCHFRSPAAAYTASMVYTDNNALRFSRCRFSYQGTSGTSVGIQNANAAKPVQVDECIFETLSGSSTNYGIQIFAGMRVTVSDSNYFTGVTRYYQPASTDIAESTRSYLAMGSATTGSISGTTNTVPDFYRSYSLISTNAAAPTITMPKLLYYGQPLVIVTMNNSGGGWASNPGYADAPGVGTATLSPGGTPANGDVMSIHFIGAPRNGSPYWIQVGPQSLGIPG